MSENELENRFVPFSAQQAGIAARLQYKWGKSLTEAVDMAREAVACRLDPPNSEDINPN